MVTDRTRFAVPAAGEVFAEAEWRVLEALVAAGVGGIQLREKDLDGNALFERARHLVAFCRPRGVRVIVNDRADVACLAEADGVHLPGNGLPVSAARALVGPERIVGRSIHAASDLSDSEGADYVIFGPIFDTPSKRRYGRPQGLERLSDVARLATPAIFAIGGIRGERASDVIAHGARGLAVMGALLDAVAPSTEVAALREALVAVGTMVDGS